MHAAQGQEQAFLLLQWQHVDQDPQNQPLHSEEALNLLRVQDAGQIKSGHVKIEKRLDDCLEGLLVKELQE